MESFGFESFVVGGCIRDYFMKNTPKDWDIATAAKPFQIAYILKNSGFRIITTSIKYGTIHVILDKETYETFLDEFPIYRGCWLLSVQRFQILRCCHRLTR